ncbi:WD40-repeat-containing domain protein [Mycena rosella]|uniref:Pre-mRNA-splicing factor PRP46 n=1 Tax=Mycena rosella TaxID=1033263 RepID=A0AAD7MCR1_MYCRO|nr:WD40-repeat-containing domain protein [Mycena rosella]
MATAALPHWILVFAEARGSERRRDEVIIFSASVLLSHWMHSARIRLSVKIHDEYRDFQEFPQALLSQQGNVGPSRPRDRTSRMIAAIDNTPIAHPSTFPSSTKLSQALTQHKTTRTIKPTYHPPWKLVRVISGHLGWVRSVAVEVGNQWFAAGAGDRQVQIFLMSGELKVSLMGHISTVRGLVVSSRHPYLFSCGEDKMVRCWDLEANNIIQHYHRHLSGVYAMSLHPTLDVLVTAVWDMHTKAQIHVLSGHTATVADVKCQESDPQVITGSMDSSVQLWDLAAGKTRSVRALAIHPTEYWFASGSAGGNSIKKWKCSEGTLVFNFSGHNAMINTLSVNAEGDVPQPGPFEAEAGVFCSTFDMTSTRLYWWGG